MTDDQTQSVSNEALQARIDQLEESLKERDPSVFRAIKTFVQDFAAFKAGERDFPQAAALGLVLAYLRPRIILVIGSLAAVAFAGMQVWLLISQNRLIEQQNTMLESQARSNRMQAISALLAGLDSEKPSLATLSQLSTFGEEGFDVLFELASRDRSYAFPLLLAGVKRHTGEQAARVVERLVLEIGKEITSEPGEQKPISIVRMDEWMRMKQPNIHTPTMSRAIVDLQNYLNKAQKVDFTSFSESEIRGLVNAILSIYWHYDVIVDRDGSMVFDETYVANLALSRVCEKIREKGKGSGFRNDSLWTSMSTVARQLSEEERKTLSASTYVGLFVYVRCAPDHTQWLGDMRLQPPLVFRAFELIVAHENKLATARAGVSPGPSRRAGEMLRELSRRPG
jgi:hypothetical protein